LSFAQKKNKEKYDMNSVKDTFILHNGVKIPCIGYGTWLTANEQAADAVKTAIKLGYRHVDTAAKYENEEGVGAGILASGVAREEIFVTSKVWNDNRGYDKTMKSFEKTLADLGLDYLDLFLIHWPASPLQYEDYNAVNLSTWRAMVELYRAGKIRAIGVSNFLPHHLDVLAESEIVPMVNQIEFHPGQMQTETLEYCRRHNILVEAWGPLGRGKMLGNPTLVAIARKYRKTVAQLCIRWCLQNGVLPLPKSVTPARIAENADVFDFVISDEDMQTINDMEYFGGSGHNPDTFGMKK
jgi:diketogulonate reductase-like aldo/keto reductase